LAGSIHLLKASDAALPAAFERAYSHSQTLVMELDLGKLTPRDAAGWILEHGSVPQGSSLRASIGEQRYQRVLAASTQLGLPREELDQFAPWVLGLQLLDLQYGQLGFDPQQGVEEQLERRAKSDRKPTEGLETLAEQLGVLQALSSEDQARFLDLAVSEPAELESETESVVLAWRAGDADKLAALLGEEFKSFPVLYAALVTQRNLRWLPRIEKLLKDKQDYLVVVGALHLVGKGGLLELLRKDGYTPTSMN